MNYLPTLTRFPQSKKCKFCNFQKLTLTTNKIITIKTRQSGHFQRPVRQINGLKLMFISLPLIELPLNNLTLVSPTSPVKTQ